MASFSLIFYFFFFVITIFIPLSTSQLTNSSKIDGFAVRLIHRDSPLSPFYNHSLTTFDRFRSAVDRSFSRLNYIHFLTSPSLNSDSDDDISSKLVPENNDYLMIFSIGTPPAQVYAIADTGSDLTWVKCWPCKDCNAKTPRIFDPSMSSTYEKLSCRSNSCNSLGIKRRFCNDSNVGEPCYYEQAYGDRSTTTGTLSFDKFSFEDADSMHAVDVGHLSFGCADDAYGPTFSNKNVGVAGLSRGGLSLVSQLGCAKFAYCMVTPGTKSSGNRMYFGSEAVISGGQAPLLKRRSTLYHLTLQGISVGDEKVPIPSGVFDITEEGQGGFIIDSGTSYTMLREEAFDALVETLSKAINLTQRRNSLGEVYFEGSSDELALKPDITFHFYGADVILTKETTYMEINGHWFLAILKSNSLWSILGNVQQRNYYVGYDLEEEVVSFAPVDCSIF